MRRMAHVCRLHASSQPCLLGPLMHCLCLQERKPIPLKFNCPWETCSAQALTLEEAKAHFNFMPVSKQDLLACSQSLPL